MTQGVVPRPLWEKLLIPDAWAVSWQRKKAGSTLLGPPRTEAWKNICLKHWKKLQYMERTGEFLSAFCCCFLRPVLEVVTSQKQLHRAGLNGLKSVKRHTPGIRVSIWLKKISVPTQVMDLNFWDRLAMVRPKQPRALSEHLDSIRRKKKEQDENSKGRFSSGQRAFIEIRYYSHSTNLQIPILQHNV